MDATNQKLWDGIYRKLDQQEWKEEGAKYTRRVILEDVTADQIKAEIKNHPYMELVAENPVTIEEAGESEDFCARCDTFVGSGDLDEDGNCEECSEEQEPPEFDPDYFDSDAYMAERFADPGGNSSLWAATEDNPRIYPCKSCGRENMLTARDKASGYCCDRCADQTERGGY